MYVYFLHPGYRKSQVREIHHTLTHDFMSNIHIRCALHTNGPYHGASASFCPEKFSGRLWTPLGVSKDTRTQLSLLLFSAIFLTTMHVTMQSHFWFRLGTSFILYITLQPHTQATWAGYEANDPVTLRMQRVQIPPILGRRQILELPPTPPRDTQYFDRETV